MAGGGGGGRGPGGAKRARIEIVPLIDIMFFLLATFVMVSASMVKNEGVSVALAGASTSAAKDQSVETTALSVSKDGDVYYNQDKITMAQLPFRLQALKAAQTDPRIVINADAGANYQSVVQVLDETRKIGIAKVGLSTKSK
jgi:biopolymer transport protein ExbD